MQENNNMIPTGKPFIGHKNWEILHNTTIKTMKDLVDFVWKEKEYFMSFTNTSYLHLPVRV